MKIKYSKLILIIGLFIIASCGEKDPNLHGIIWFLNNSDKTVFLGPQFTGFDDSLIFFSNPALSGEYYKSYPNTKDDQLSLTDTYEGRFNDPSIDLLRIYLFDEEIIAEYDWDTIVSNYMVLKRYDLTLDDLNNLDWIVEYSE
jgi:hypothetical protein